MTETQTVDVDTLLELTSRLSRNDTRIYGTFGRRRDADEDAEPYEDDGGPQQFHISAASNIGARSLLLRIDVATENKYGQLSVDLGVRYAWDAPLEIDENVVDEFVMEIALPEAVTHARLHLRQLAKSLGIRSDPLPARASLPRFANPHA